MLKIFFSILSVHAFRSLDCWKNFVNFSFLKTSFIAEKTPFLFPLPPSTPSLFSRRDHPQIQHLKTTTINMRSPPRFQFFDVPVITPPGPNPDYCGRHKIPTPREIESHPHYSSIFPFNMHLSIRNSSCTNRTFSPPFPTSPPFFLLVDERKAFKRGIVQPTAHPPPPSYFPPPIPSSEFT